MSPRLKLVTEGTRSKARDPEMEGIELRGDSIRLTFWWMGSRCRETLKMQATPKNIEYAKRLRKRILLEIEAETFRYIDHFPESKRASKAGMTPATSRLFREYAEQWFKNKNDIGSASLKDYRSFLDRFWLPSLGHVRGDQLVPSMIHEAIGKISWRSAKHKNDALVPLRAVLKLMFGDEATRKNLAEFIKNDKRQKPEPNPLTADQVDMLLERIREDFGPEMHNLFDLGFFTGMRPGELIAIYWSDVNFDLEILTVQRSWGHDKDEDEGDSRNETKTKKARHLELSSRAIAALRRQKDFTGDGREVFLTRRDREPYSSSDHLYRRVWAPTLHALQISTRRMYQMRHTYATMNLMAGANPAWIAEQLGHINAQLVFTTYGKWIKGADKIRQKGLLDDWLAQGCAPAVPQMPEGKGAE
ncbi:MAG TPA: DUF3596 domain-containing protein [Rhodocyclaceae bacterium]